MSQSPDPILDPATLDRLRDLVQLRRDTRLLTRLTELFVQDTTTRLAMLRTAVARRDDETVHAIAHSMRGGAATLGACEIVHLCAELEHLPPEWPINRALRRVDVLAAAFARTELALSAFIADIERDLVTGA